MNHSASVQVVNNYLTFNNYFILNNYFIFNKIHQPLLKQAAYFWNLSSLKWLNNLLHLVLRAI